MSLLDQLSDFVAETSEQAVKVFEEGSAIFLEGGAGAGAGAASGPGAANDHDPRIATPADDTDIDIDIDIGMEEDIDIHMESPLNGIADEVLHGIFQNQAKPQSTWESIQAFQSAITWSEPFILALLAFHAFMLFAMFYAVRKGGVVSQFSVLGCIFAVVRFAEYWNALGDEHWETFATQNYFDRNGVFVSLMVSAPLLGISMLMLVCFVREAAGLLIEVKKYQLREKAGRASAKAGKMKPSGSGNNKNIKKEKKEN